MKEEARFRLHGDGLHDASPSADDEGGVFNNLRQQLALAVCVSSVAI